MHLNHWLAAGIVLAGFACNTAWGYVNGIGRDAWNKMTPQERAAYERPGRTGAQSRGSAAGGFSFRPAAPAPLPSLPQLIENLKNPDARIRHAATYRLRETGETGKFAVPMLIQALRDPDSDVRWVAAGTLGELKSNAADALPALKRLSEDVNPQVRRAAADAVQQIEAAMKVSAVSSKP